MKTRFAITCVAAATLLGSPVAMAAEESDSAHAAAYVKDSAITTEIKTKLAAEHLTSLEHIHVGTDANGVVWLSGSAGTREAADQAVLIARDTSGVTKVHSNIKVRSND